MNIYFNEREARELYDAGTEVLTLTRKQLFELFKRIEAEKPADDDPIITRASRLQSIELALRNATRKLGRHLP